MCFKRILFFILGFTLFSTRSYSQDTAYLSKPPIVISRLEGSVQLDGLSNEEAWQRIPSLPFIVYEPVWGAPATERTELRIAYDDRFLYAAGRCYTKDSTTIVGRNLVRDGWRGDDWMTIHIDSRFDHQNAFVFSIYPLGSRYDMMTSNDAIELGSSTFNDAFNMIWDAKVVRNKEGWFFEMKIPLYNLRYSKNSQGQVQMAISSTRAIQYKQEYHQFPALSRNIPDAIMKPSIKQPVLFTELKRSKLLLATPYLTAGRERTYRINKSATSFEAIKKNQFDAGIDVKAGVSSYLTLDLSVNPDFAQVEADDQQINLSRFSLFFPEKRMFFQEQAGLFEFVLGGNAQLFYSRRIGINNGQLTPIYGGARLTGKLNLQTDIGLLSMQSARQTLDDSSAINSENFSVVRLRRRVLNDRSFVGAMITSKIGSAIQNLAYGVDGLLHLGKTNYLLLSAANTISSSRQKEASLALSSSRFTVSYDNRKREGLIYKTGYTYSGADFDPQVGFVNRRNMHNASINTSYGKFAKNNQSKFQYQQITLARADAYWSATKGYLESMETGIGWMATTFKGLNLNLQLVNSYEFVADSLDFGNGIVVGRGKYTAPSAWLFFTPPRYKKLRVPITVSHSRFFGGQKFYGSINPTISLGRNAEVVPGYEINVINMPALATTRIHIARLKMNYALNLHLSANVNLQYISTQKQVFVNTRVRYNFRDGHDLYVVLNNISNTDTYYNGLLKKPTTERLTLLLKYNYTLHPLSKKSR